MHPLPATLNSTAAGQLRSSLKQAITGPDPIVLGGAQVDQIGLACLQVLVAARKAAGDAGKEFRIEQPSETMATMIRLCGLDQLLEPVAEGVNA